MHGLTSLDLARIQFGFTVSIHILYLALGLAGVGTVFVCASLVRWLMLAVGVPD